MAVISFQVLPHDLRSKGVDERARGIVSIHVDWLYLDTDVPAFVTELYVSPFAGISLFFAVDAKPARLCNSESFSQPQLKILFRHTPVEEIPVAKGALLDT